MESYLSNITLIPLIEDIMSFLQGLERHLTLKLRPPILSSLDPPLQPQFPTTVMNYHPQSHLNR